MLLTGGFRESSSDCQQVALRDLNAGAFDFTLTYLYTGRLAVPAALPCEETLLAAAGTADVAGVGRAIAEGADVDARGRDGLTSAHLAASHGTLDDEAACASIISMLAAAGADLNLLSPQELTPLAIAVPTTQR